MSARWRRGFVLERKVERESDLRLALLLDDGTVASAWAPSGNASRKRFAGGLGALVLYKFSLTEARKGLRLEEALVERAWARLWTRLDRQTAATTGTAVARELAEHAPGGSHAMLLLGELFEALDAVEAPGHAASLVVRFAFELLADSGHAVALDRCVRCDTPVPPGALVTVDPAAGGVVCRGCGGGPLRVSAVDRAALSAVLRGDHSAWNRGLWRVATSVLAGLAPRTAEVFDRVEGLLAPSLREA